VTPVNGSDLLKLLSSGVRPAGVEPQGAARGPGGELGFAHLLRQARSGAAQSGLPVALDTSIGLELDASGHDRLSRAVDQLQASGAQRGVVLIEGRALLVDVATRQVTGVVSSDSGVLDVDGVVSADESEAPAAAGGGDPSWRISNEHLGRLLGA
jgi:hypothetical protein